MTVYSHKLEILEGRRPLTNKLIIDEDRKEQYKDAVDSKEDAVSVHTRCRFVREEGELRIFQLIGPEGPYWPE